MVNIDERARRSSDSPEPRPEHVPESLTPDISEDRNQSLKHDHSEYRVCDLSRTPRSNEQEVSSDSNDSSSLVSCSGLDYEVGSRRQPTEEDKRKFYDKHSDRVCKRPASFGKGKKIYAEYTEKFRALYEEMLNHTLLVENLNLPNRVRCVDRARDEASQIVMKALKEEQNYQSVLRKEVGGAGEYMQFIGFEMMSTMGCGRTIYFQLPKDEEPPKDKESPKGRPVKKRQGPDEDWLLD